MISDVPLLPLTQLLVERVVRPLAHGSAVQSNLFKKILPVLGQVLHRISVVAPRQQLQPLVVGVGGSPLLASQVLVLTTAYRFHYLFHTARQRGLPLPSLSSLGRCTHLIVTLPHTRRNTALLVLVRIKRKTTSFPQHALSHFHSRVAELLSLFVLGVAQLLTILAPIPVVVVVLRLFLRVLTRPSRGHYFFRISAYSLLRLPRAPRCNRFVLLLLIRGVVQITRGASG